MAITSFITKKNSFILHDGLNTTLMELELVRSYDLNLPTDISSDETKDEKTTDQIKNAPIILSMECVISKNPVSITSNIGGAISSLAPANPIVQQLVGSEINQQDEKYNNELLANSTQREKDAYNILFNMRKRKVPFDISLDVTILKNMFFTNINIIKDPSSENTLLFNLDMQKLDIVSSGKKLAKGRIVGSKTNKGSKKPKSATAPKEQSILFKAILG